MSVLQNTIKCTSLFLVLTLIGCNQKPSETHLKLESNQAQLEANLLMYETLINSDSFDQNVTAVATSAGDIIGLENFKNYYNNYLTGFSDAEFTIIDAFGQGDKIVKHWNFKGTHDGDFFGVPATGKRVDVSGVTLVKMKSGKIFAEQDFMDLLDFYTQLGLM